MIREVVLSFEGKEETYPVDTETHYAARVEALGKFLETYKIPGRPVDYIVGRFKGLIGITVRSAIDRRSLPRNSDPDDAFFLDQVGRLRVHVRTSSRLTDKSKTKATRLLLQLEEVLSG